MKTSTYLNSTTVFFSNFISNKTNIFLIKFNFLVHYWYLNELIWQEGLLVDFLQKKICDNWIKKFLIHSAYLFSERYLFEKVIKTVMNLVITPLHKLSIFDLNNTAMLFYYIFILFFLIFYSIFFFFVFFLMF